MRADKIGGLVFVGLVVALLAVNGAPEVVWWVVGATAFIALLGVARLD